MSTTFPPGPPPPLPKTPKHAVTVVVDPARPIDDCRLSAQERMDGTVFLSVKQKQWVQVMYDITALRAVRRPRAPRKDAVCRKVRLQFFLVAESRRFEIAITLLIMLNVVVMATDMDDSLLSSGHKTALEVSNVVFSTLYVLEFFIKLLGLGYIQYYSDTWNTFDFLLCIAAVFDVVMYGIGVEALAIDPIMIRNRHATPRAHRVAARVTARESTRQHCSRRQHSPARH